MTTGPDDGTTVGLSIEQQTLTVTLTGALDMATARRPATAITELLAELAPTSPVTRVVIDLHAVSFVDAAGLGGLVAARNAATAHHSELVLRGASPRLRRLLEITALRAHFAYV